MIHPMSIRSFLCFQALVLTFTFCTWAETNISYQNFQRLNDPGRMAKSQDRLRLNIDEDYRFTTSSFKTDLSFELYFADRSMNYSVGEAYYYFSYYDLDFSIGRKILDWSSNERFWGNNYLNSRRNFTLLDTKREGLLGLHHSSRMPGNFSYDIFFSYFHVPTMNPSVDIKNGQVSSDSEWVALPPTHTSIYGVQMPISYYLNRPKLKDLIFKKSLGGRLSYHWDIQDGRQPGRLSAYGIYKPENSLRINAEAGYNYQQEEISAVANPIVNHHTVLGLSAVQEFKNLDRTWAVSSDLMMIDPNAKIGKDFDTIDPIRLKETGRSFESNLFTLRPNYDRESYWQGAVSRFGERFSYSLHYLKLLSRPLPGDDFYSQANRWINAFGLDIQTTIDERVDLGLDFKYDFDRKDVLAVAEVGYILNREILLGVGLELLRVPGSTSFWTPYRANDTLYVRLGHIF